MERVGASAQHPSELLHTGYKVLSQGSWAYLLTSPNRQKKVDGVSVGWSKHNNLCRWIVCESESKCQRSVVFSSVFSAICHDSIKGGNNVWKENKTWSSMAIHNTKLACLEWPFSFLEMEFYYYPVTNANFFLAWAALSLSFPSR